MKKKKKKKLYVLFQKYANVHVFWTIMYSIKK
jgi:hypothetical protein